jgi:hypothetical protein
VEDKQVKNKSQLMDQERREFIKKSALLGAGAAATTMASTQAIADVGAESAEPAKEKGYQLTQHVLDYYKSAGI